MKKWSENFCLIVPRESVTCVRSDHKSCNLAAGSAIWIKTRARRLKAAPLHEELVQSGGEVTP